MSFSGKVVVVTGAAGGIGKETVKAFVEQEAKVVLVDLEQDTLESTAKDLNLIEGEYLLVAADVTKEADVEGYVTKTKETFGRIDVFFNNAGIEGKIVPLTDYPSDVFESVLNVNVMGVFYGLKHVLRVMSDQKSGSVINTSSISGLNGIAGVSAYIASKHAVNGLTKTAALEMAPYGVRVNNINPSTVDTRIMRTFESAAAPDDVAAAREAFTQAIPLARYGKPEDIANLVLFLASDKSSFITGTDHRIDGGQLAGVRGY
ncbi:SDR family oxidoreductase [Peribacillus cavernae]|uniref:SDR family oxidoreductase n=1 Tax=Peribacillus cavernae TaxID=1674310 RepID=A0A3S0VM62_9BACI|nr:SDR family oxidoreductase [Peribacillus cavernae]MDQ0219136.1 NAD(P)-dependent dehydrogenase (short-subunit alcohol dehydrogenase family) [Peribacillus cavernae]RUQ28634.1 SDR family oxidoreductase [Peribacillus cavernae]